MSTIGNILWIFMGGLAAAVGYFLGGLLLCITVVGIPFGLQCFKLAGLMLTPFGRKVVPAASGQGCLSVFANIIWIFSFGLYVAFVHVISGVLCFISIIGIPFGIQHFKFAGLALAPFGQRII
jgi:uncharacterized membrane protein YccF (DUF307 family)